MITSLRPCTFESAWMPCQIIARPAIGNSGLGVVSVSGRILVPFDGPPIR